MLVPLGIGYYYYRTKRNSELFFFWHCNQNFYSIKISGGQTSLLIAPPPPRMQPCCTLVGQINVSYAIPQMICMQLVHEAQIVICKACRSVCRVFAEYETEYY